MNTAKVDSFSARLTTELSILGWQDRNDLLGRIGRMELQMRGNGQERPVWKGPLPEDRMLGADVAVQTDQGEVRGRVICFGVLNVGSEYERSVIVHVPSSGTQHEVPGSVTRLASPEDSERIKNEITMATRLTEAAVAVERGSDPSRAVVPPKKRGLKDPKLIERMLDAARASTNVRSVDDAASNHKVVGADGNRRLYVFKNQLRVDVSGFTFDHPGLRKISDDEARDMHLGKVRGQVLFDDRETAFSAFETALGLLKK